MTCPPRARVLMAGPLAPAVGGMVSVVRDLSESRLRETFALETFDTATYTPKDRSLAAAVKARLGLWLRWWRAVGRGNAGVVHIHTCSGLSYFLDGALAVLAKVRGAPVILHVHGGRFDSFIDELGPFRKALAHAIGRLAGRVIVLSEYWRQALSTRLPGARLQVIENAVPSQGEQTVRARTGLPLVLFVGAISRAKGVEDLVKAFANVPAPARLVLVGPEAEHGIIDELQALARRLGADDRIECPGPTDSAGVREWLGRASLLALPSYFEGMPIVLLEAMAAGLPVVATPVGAVRAIVEEGRSGLLIDAGDVEALAAAINRLLADERLRDEFGRRGRALWADRHSIDRAAAELRELYLELLADRGAR